MEKEICGSIQEPKKSLMNALENIEKKASSLMDLANFSDQVVKKLLDPRPQPQPDTSNTCIEKSCVEEIRPDLIGLFNLVAEKIDNATRRIGNNMEQINSIIE